MANSWEALATPPEGTMNDYQLVGYIDFLSERLQESTELRKLLFELYNQRQGLLPDLTKAVGITEASQIVRQIQNVRSQLHDTVRLIKEFTPSHVIRGIARLQSTLEDAAWPSTASGVDVIHSLRESLHTFEGIYNAYLHAANDKQSPAALDLTIYGAQLAQEIQLVVSTMQDIRGKILVPSATPDGYEELSLYFPVASRLTDLVRKLQALEELYEEACQLTGTSSTTHPLHIRKVATGSLWADVQGAKEPLALMLSLLKEAAGYFWRTRTTEGKIASIPKAADALERSLGLAEKLRQMGVDTTQMDAINKNSAVKIAGQLNDLLADQTHVELNGIEYTIVEETRRKALKPPARLLGSGHEQGQDGAA